MTIACFVDLSGRTKVQIRDTGFVGADAKFRRCYRPQDLDQSITVLVVGMDSQIIDELMDIWNSFFFDSLPVLPLSQVQYGRRPVFLTGGDLLVPTESRPKVTEAMEDTSAALTWGISPEAAAAILEVNASSLFMGRSRASIATPKYYFVTRGAPMRTEQSTKEPT